MIMKLGRNTTAGRKFYGGGGGGRHDKENFLSGIIFLGYKRLFSRKVGGHSHQPPSSYDTEGYAMAEEIFRNF